MRKVILIILVFFGTISVNGQLSNTHWKGMLNIQGGMDVIFNFGKDTLNVVTPDNESLETMKYYTNDTLLTLIKVEGSSQCNTTPGLYHFEVSGNEMTLKLISDSCSDRSEAIGSMKLNRE